MKWLYVAIKLATLEIISRLHVASYISNFYNQIFNVFYRNHITFVLKIQDLYESQKSGKITRAQEFRASIL